MSDETNGIDSEQNAADDVKNDQSQTDDVKGGSESVDDNKGSSSLWGSDDETKGGENEKTDDKDDKSGDDKETDKSENVIDYSGLDFGEGVDVDENQLNEFTGLAQSLNDGKGISKEDAQKLIDFDKQRNQQAVDHWNKQYADWQEEIKSDKELGGDNLVKNTKPNIIAALEKFGDDNIKKMFLSSDSSQGLNPMYANNPNLIRLLNNVGKMLREDSISRSQNQKPQKSEREKQLDEMFPDEILNAN